MDEAGKKVTRIKIAGLGRRLEVGDRVRLPDGKGTGSVIEIGSKLPDNEQHSPFEPANYRCKVKCDKTGEVASFALSSRAII